MSVYVYGSNISVFPLFLFHSFLFISNIASSAMSLVFVEQRVVRYVFVGQGTCFHAVLGVPVKYNALVCMSPFARLVFDSSCGTGEARK